MADLKFVGYLSCLMSKQFDRQVSDIRAIGNEVNLNHAALIASYSSCVLHRRRN